MIRFWMEKTWVQNAVLAAIGLAMVYYWGFVFTFGYHFDWTVLYTVNPTYKINLGLELLKGLRLTIIISVVSSVAALLLGTVFGLGRLSHFGPMRWISTGYVELMRNTPLLVQLFFWYFAFPRALPDNFRQSIFDLHVLGVVNFEFLCATVGLSVYTGAFIAEVVRAGLQSIPKGLLEAAYSSGLSYVQVLTKIILPLAFRTIIPPLGSELLSNMKNSSLAIVVGAPELCWSSQQIESLTFKGFEATTAATALYLMVSLAISSIMNTINRRMKIESMARRASRLPGPVSRFWNSLVREKVLRPIREGRSIGGPVTLSYSQSQAVLHAAGRITTKIVVLLGKVVFLAALAGIVYKAAVGILGFNWGVVFGNLRTLLIWRFPNGDPHELFWGLGGLAFSILMAVIAITLSFFIGLIVGMGRTSKNRIFRLPSLAYIEIIRGTPLIMVIFWVYFFVPVLFNTFLDVFWSATLALTLFTGAYLAEIVRAGIENVPPGQSEAAYSTGLSSLQTMRKIILPQALKQMIPAIVGQFIAIFKDTSLAYVIGVLELTFVAQGLNNRLMVYPFEIYTTVAALYFICCYCLSILATRLERKLTPERISLTM